MIKIFAYLKRNVIYPLFIAINKFQKSLFRLFLNDIH